MNARFIAIPPGISAVNPNIAGLTLPPGASGPALLAITRAVLFRRSGSDLNQIGLISDLRTAGTPASRMNGAALETIDQGADGDGGFDEMADLQGTCDFFGAYPMEAAAGGATTLRAVRCAAEYARLNTGFEVG